MDLDALLKETEEARKALQAGLPVGGPSRPAQPEKRKTLEGILAEGVLQVQADTTLPGVDLPDDLVGQLLVVLNFSYKYAGQDLLMSDDLIEQTLSFGGKSHHVRLPLKAILAARSLKTGRLEDFQVFTGGELNQDDDDPREPA